MQSTEASYAQSGLDRFFEESEIPGMLLTNIDRYMDHLAHTREILPIYSNPTEEDTDGEGIPDNIDIRPLKYDDYADKYIEFINAGYIDMNKMIQTRDGFTICMTPLSEILDHLNYPNLDIHFLSNYKSANEKEGTEEVPATIGYDKYADFCYLYSVQTEDTVVYSMIKLRENNSIFSSGVSVPFIEFDIELLKDYDKTVDLDVLDSEFRKVMGGKEAVHNDVLVEYFGYMPSEALLLIPQLYIDIILEKECIDRGTNILWITEKVCSYSRNKLNEYKYDISQEVIYIPHDIFDTVYDYLVINDVTNPTLAEKQCILAVRSDNPCFDSFAAEIVYHALAVGWYEGVFDYGYKAAIKADLAPGDGEVINKLFHSEGPYKANDGEYVVFMSMISGGM